VSSGWRYDARTGNPTGPQGQPDFWNYDPTTGEWSFTYDLTVGDTVTSCVQSREVHWVDSEGAAARAEIARQAGWGGIALWALGYDDDETWQSLLNATRNPMAATAGV